MDSPASVDSRAVEKNTIISSILNKPSKKSKISKKQNIRKPKKRVTKEGRLETPYKCDRKFISVFINVNYI